MPDDEKTLKVQFYQTDLGGKPPVWEWLTHLSQADKKIIGEDIKTIEYGWPVGMPTCRPLGGGLWEVRSNISSGRIARVIFCIADSHMILLHAFIKKSQKTPADDLKLAQQRMKEVQS